MGERLNGIQEVRGSIPLASIPCAGIAQLVEHNLAKVGVAGSSPVSRSPEVLIERIWKQPSARGRLAQLVRAPR